MQEDNSKKTEHAAEHDDTSALPEDDQGGELGTGSAPQTLSVEGVVEGDRAVTRTGSRSTTDQDSDGEGEEEETWTNAPAGAASQGDELSRDEVDEDEEEEEEAPVVTRKVIQNARDVLCEELPVRAERAKLRLRPQLTGAFLIEVSNTGEKFIFDWRGQEPKVSPVEGAVELATADNADPSKVDSIISVSDQHLMAIRSGDLNPQVAMLADKIRVKGKMGPAVYLFNLVAPRVRD